MENRQKSIGREAAVALAESKWWEGKTARQVAEFQLTTVEICMPFRVFHKCLEEAIGRPVLTHELARNFDGLMAELSGDGPSPSMQEVLDMIPAGKRIVVSVDAASPPT